MLASVECFDGRALREVAPLRTPAPPRAACSVAAFGPVEGFRQLESARVLGPVEGFRLVTWLNISGCGTRKLNAMSNSFLIVGLQYGTAGRLLVQVML